MARLDHNRLIDKQKGAWGEKAEHIKDKKPRARGTFGPASEVRTIYSRDSIPPEVEAEFEADQ